MITKTNYQISNASNKYDSLLKKTHRMFYSLNPSTKTFEMLIKKGHALRPHYALGILRAAYLAKNLSYKKISIIEFGVAGGAGLVDIEYYANEITNLLEVEFEIYGFDSAEGLPDTNDYRDGLYLWKPKQLKMDINQLKSRLNDAKLVLGLVKETTKNFFKKHNPAPIGCIFNDLDYYTSTKDSFKIFDFDEKFYLPRIVMYFDNLHYTGNYCGELCAINEFNRNNDHRKIDLMHHLAEELSLYWKNWIYLGKRFYLYHSFLHSKYSDYTRKGEIELKLD